MGSKDDEECDINSSEMNEYKDATYKFLKFRTYNVRAPNGAFKCPFCTEKEQVYQYTLLLQHAIRVAEGSEDSAKHRASHFALATYLVTDLADEAEPPPAPENTGPSDEGGDEFKSAMDSVQGCYQKLVEKLKEKDDELSCLISKERESNDALQEARKAIIEGLKDMPIQGRVIGVKKMGELDLKAFVKACHKKYPTRQQVHTKAAELCSDWQEKLKNPEWHPFLLVDGKWGEIVRKVDQQDASLMGIMNEWGEDVYEAVVKALEELNENNPSGCYPVPELWNFKEQRKATLQEVLTYVFAQLKTLKRKRF